MKDYTLQWLLKLSGILCLTLGVIGVILPLLPTVPFILLAAFCFAKSSPRLHQWLHQHKYFGPILEDFQSGKGIPLAVRKRAIIMIWLSLLFSMVIVATLWAICLLSIIGVAVTLYLLQLPLREAFNK